MTIVLVEERDGQHGPERAFAQHTIPVGRDPTECLLVFDRTEWPMVSRRHAEIQLDNGRYLLVDTHSSLGTFLDGQRVVEPVEIKTGAGLQFGVRGPAVRVARIEQAVPATDAPTTGLAVAVRVVSPADSRGDPQQRPPVHAPAGPSVPTAELVREVAGRSERIAIGHKDIVLLGRDPDADVVIDAEGAVVSRRHAEIRRQDGRCVLVDLGSFNGTLIDGARITAPTLLYDGNSIQLGPGGPFLRFHDPAHPPPVADPTPTPSPVQASAIVDPEIHTMLVKAGSGPPSQQMRRPVDAARRPQLLMKLAFDGLAQISIGRAADNNIRLEGLQISNHHARIKKEAGGVFIEDAGSTNGVYVNGERISGRRSVQSRDILLIGPFILEADAQRGVSVFDTRSKTRIDVIDITKVVTNRSGGGTIKLLDDIDLTIQPNEFVGLLGPSGAGKSTLMDSLNGMRPASSGQVLINSLDLYRHLDSLKQSIGYVPQDDIIHRELTVYRTLYYVARLRLSHDVAPSEIDQIVNEVMDVTALSERRDVPVDQLSGGQRKRVSIAVELITKPSMIFLDEPTSGLDPATEDKIMRLFRQIAESGRTVIMTTHAMENVRLFDKIAVMMRGRLVFFGTPHEALAHVQADSFKDLYDKLEAPIDVRMAKTEGRGKEQIAEEVAEEWRQRFQRTEQYQRNVVQPVSGLKRELQAPAPVRVRPTATDAFKQWATLSHRYMEVLARDRFNLLILLGQAPIVALLTYLVVGSDQPRDFPYFMLALVAVWFGTSVAAREVIRERAVYNRDRMVNLGLLPYIGSKISVLSAIVGLQCLLLFGTLKIFHVVGLMSFPGYALGLPQLIVMIVTGMVGIALGLFVSSVVKTSEMATSLVPLILIPQILFSGLVGVPQGIIVKSIGALMPATWSFDEMKRLSGLDTLREEGANATGPTQGRGLYKQIEHQNEDVIARARSSIEKYRTDADGKSKDYQRKMEDYVRSLRTNPLARRPNAPVLAPPPAIEAARKVPDSLSAYVSFLHPLGNVLVNPIVLMTMFAALIVLTVLALRAQDIR